jgi:hypothetical protein
MSKEKNIILTIFWPLPRLMNWVYTSAAAYDGSERKEQKLARLRKM